MLVHAVAMNMGIPALWVKVIANVQVLPLGIPWLVCSLSQSSFVSTGKTIYRATSNFLPEASFSLTDCRIADRVKEILRVRGVEHEPAANLDLFARKVVRLAFGQFHQHDRRHLRLF